MPKNVKPPNSSIPSSNNSPLITTIVTTYRRPHLLKRALRSVLNQTYPHFQVCIYDNASGDETSRVAHEFSQTDPRVKYYCHAENKGVEFNLKYGVAQVQTPFFSFLPDDDVLLPEFYQIAMEGFEKFPDALFSGGACIVMTPTGRVVRVSPSSWRRKEGHFEPPEGLFEILKKASDRHPIITSLVFKKNVFEKVGPMDFTEGLPFDMDYILRIAINDSFVMSQKPCSIYILNPLSEYTSKPVFLRYQGFKKMVQNLMSNPLIPAKIRARIKPMLAEHLKEGIITLALKAFVQRDFESALKLSDILKKDLRRIQEAAFLKSTIDSAVKFPERHSKFIQKLKSRLLSPISFHSLQKKYGCYAKRLWV